MSWALKEAKDFDHWGWNGKETHADNALSRNKAVKEPKPRGCLEQALQYHLLEKHTRAITG